jgi:hypothetical protein
MSVCEDSDIKLARMLPPHREQGPLSKRRKRPEEPPAASSCEMESCSQFTRRSCASRLSSIMSASLRLVNCVKSCSKVSRLSSSSRQLSTTCAVALPRRKPLFFSPRDPAAEEEASAASTSAAAAPQGESEPQPWFVDPTFLRPSASSQPAPPPPPHIPQHFHALHEYLVTSPFFDPESVVFVDARSATGDGSLWEWVVVATLRSGRERSIRGAADGVKDVVSLPAQEQPKGTRAITQNGHTAPPQDWLLQSATRRALAGRATLGTRRRK